MKYKPAPPATISRMPSSMFDVPDPVRLLENLQRKRYQDKLDSDKCVRQEREEECRQRAVAAGKPLPPPGRLRLPGGGRKPISEKYPEIIPFLYGMLIPSRSPDYVPPLRWTTLTDKEIAERLSSAGFTISAASIPSLLHRAELRQHPTVRIPKNRPSPKDKQFDFINRHVMQALRNDQRVYFVDFHIENAHHASEPGLNAPDRTCEQRCKHIVDFMCAILDHFWYGLQDGNACPMIVLEGGTLLGIDNDYFHVRLEELAEKRGMNVLLSYLPSGTSRWTLATRIFEERRHLSYGEQANDVCFITIDDIQMEPRLPGATDDRRDLGREFQGESKDLFLGDWNRVFGALK